MSDRRPRRAARAGLLALLLGLASACALPELAWNQVDDILVARVNDWLELEPRQERALRERLDPWLVELRRERLPGFAAFLRGLADRVEPDIDTADIAWADRRFNALYRDVVGSFLPVIGPTLAGLSPAQRRHLARRIEERNADYRETFVEGRDDGMYALAERIISAVERWTGALDATQRALVHERVHALPRTAAAWLAYRKSMQQRLLAQIEQDAGAAAIETTLDEWWVAQGRDSGAADIPTDALRTGLHSALAELGRTLSALQRAEARRRLRARADDLQTIVEAFAQPR